MARKLRHRIPVEPVPEWKARLKRLSVHVGSGSAIIFGVVEVLQSGVIALPRHLLECIPYGSAIALGLWASVLLVKMFRMKRKTNGK